MITNAAIVPTKPIPDRGVDTQHEIEARLQPPIPVRGALFRTQYEAEGGLVFWTIALGDVAQ